jgi:hypothetical protein
MAGKLIVVGAVVTVTTMLSLFSAIGPAVASQSKAVAISGPVTGHLSTSNYSDICSLGVPGRSNGHIYQSQLTLPGVKPLKGSWSLEIDAPLGTTKFPAAYPISVTLTSPGATDVADIWMAGGSPTASGSGTLTLKKNGGSFDLVLPGTQHLVSGNLVTLASEKVVGSWSCKI